MFEEKINKLKTLLEKETGKKVVLQEEGRMQADLSDIKKVANFVSNKIRKYAGNLHGAKGVINGNNLIVNDTAQKHAGSTFVQVGNDLVKSGFTKKQIIKINKLPYVEFQNKQKFAVYLPVKK